MNHCAYCKSNKLISFVDLGSSPLSNSYLKNLSDVEVFYPLHVYRCIDCGLIQIPPAVSPKEIFSDYQYFSSYSPSLVKHAEQYVDYIIDRLRLNNQSMICEIASNDGYLLQFFKQKNFNFVGIDPASNICKVANEKGIPTINEFLNQQMAKSMLKCDLVIANNVIAHVPDINDFVKSIHCILKEDGVATIEFPHISNLIRNNQFDTIYHEHFFYHSLTTMNKIFDSANLRILDVQEISTHGGSLRIFACRKTSKKYYQKERSVDQIISNENNIDYDKFQYNIKNIKYNLLSLLIDLKKKNKKIIAYGAAAKGTTLLNYCGINSDYIDYIVDDSPHKQNLFMPGCRIPILHPDKIKETNPDYILILPWNVKNDIIKKTSYWLGKYIVPIPEVKII